MRSYLDFEKPVAELEAKVDELRAMGDGRRRRHWRRNRSTGIESGGGAVDLYAALTPWEKTQVARSATTTLSGLRHGAHREFHSARRRPLFRRRRSHRWRLRQFPGESVCVIGQEKGADTGAASSTISAWPARRAIARQSVSMEMADRFGLPVISLVDTAGAYPGHRRRRARSGRSHRALDRHLSFPRRPEHWSGLGEGGSGGAIAIATANRS